MDKNEEILGTNDEKNGNNEEQAESSSMPPYRIICNSEHFIVLNPAQKKPRKDVDKGRKERGTVMIKGK